MPKRIEDSEHGMVAKEKLHVFKMPRRAFLKLMAVLAGAFGVTTLPFVATKEGRESFKASVSRLDPHNHREYDLDEPFFHAIYTELFESRTLLSLEEFREKINPLIRYATTFYDHGDKKEPFDVYFRIFLEKVITVAEKVGITTDLVTLGIHSSFAIKEIPSDQMMSWIQNYVSSLHPLKLSDPVKTALAELSGGFFEIIRMDSHLTTGMLDMEQYLLAISMKNSMPDLFNRLADIAPGLHEALVLLIESYESYLQKKDQLQEVMDEIFSKYPSMLDWFFDQNNQEHFGKTGLGKKISPWHKVSVNLAWTELIRVIKSSGSESEIHETIYKNLVQTENPGKSLMTDQLMNPLFLPYVVEQLTKQHRQDELGAVLQLNTKVQEYLEISDKVILQDKKAVVNANPLELNEDYQLITSISYLKYLSDMVIDTFGNFDSNNKNELLAHNFKMLAFREVTGAHLMKEHFAWTRADLPYNYTAVEQTLRTFFSVFAVEPTDIVGILEAYYKITDETMILTDDEQKVREKIIGIPPRYNAICMVLDLIDKTFFVDSKKK